MPRMQVYLPEDLYHEVKERGLHASELLQDAVRRELHRQEMTRQGGTYLAELLAEVGAPSPRDLAEADAVARRIRSRRSGKAS